MWFENPEFLAFGEDNLPHNDGMDQNDEVVDIELKPQNTLVEMKLNTLETINTQYFSTSRDARPCNQSG